MKGLNIMSTEIIIKMTINDCTECPKVCSGRTKDSGYALDYFCTICDNRKIMGHAEIGPNDIKPVPDWCPIKC
jgi:hypothetical protein